MKSHKSFSFLFLAVALTLLLGSCSSLPNGNVNHGGNAKVSFVLTASDPPLTLGLISFKVVPTAVTLTSSTGTQTAFNINSGNGFSFDLVRLQSDSAFLGTAATIPTGSFTTVAVSFSSAQLAFLNVSGAALTNPQCPSLAVCVATFAGPFTASITASQTISGNTGFGINIDLAKAMSVTGGTLSLSLSNAGVATAATLPRQNSNLAAGQLDLIEDVTGAATITGSSVTVNAASIMNRPPITATTNSSTILDKDPTGNLCATPAQGSVASCISSNQAVSMDAILNSDGTFTAQEVEPLLASPIVDTVEGTVVSISSPTQFSMIVTDLIPAAQNSKIASLTIGAPLRVNLSNSVAFQIDSKGLPVSTSFPTSFGQFTGSTNTGGLTLGESVAVHVPAFTAANGNTPASANSVDTVTLRWSRFSALVSQSNTQLFVITGLPLYFGFTPTSTFGVEIFGGTPGLQGVTNLDGIQSGNGPVASQAVGVRALFIEDSGATLNPAFFAAKVRQH